MSMQILSEDYWSSYLKPYVADLGVALVFGLGYYLFKHINKDATTEKSESIKESIKRNINKWTEAKTTQKFNSLIVGNKDRSMTAIKILTAMEKSGITPDIVTYNCLLDMSYRLDQHDEAKKLFDEMCDFTFPVQPDTVTYNILLKSCVAELKEATHLVAGSVSSFALKASGLKRIKGFLNDMRARGVIMNEITFNTAMDGFIEGGDFNSAWDLYQEIKISTTAKPDLYTYATLIKGFKSSNCMEDREENLDRAMEILNMIKNSSSGEIKADEVLYNSVLDTCMKYQKIELAEGLLDDMKMQGIEPSVVTYSIMIKGYGLAHKLDKSIEIFQEMKAKKLKPNDIIYGCLLNSAVKSSKIDLMKSIFENMKSEGVRPNHVIFTTLIKGFSKVKQYTKAFEIFDSIPEKEKNNGNIVIYNAILDCCVESQNFDRLTEIYNYVKKKSEELEGFPQPNVITYSTVIKGFAKAGKIQEAYQIYEFLKENAFQLDEVLFNTVCDGFARVGQVDIALKILEDMKAKGIKRSSIIYSILIKMYSNKGNEEKCIEVFGEMLKDDVKPSLVTYTTLMQMYIKKKKINDALEVFYDMKNNGAVIDQVCYNFIINACTFTQKLEKAIEILHESFCQGVKLSDETYHNVLEYLLNNKFMKYPERVRHATEILKALKESKHSIKGELYQRLMKLIYNNKEMNREIEGSLKFSFNNFSNLKENPPQRKGNYFRYKK